MPDLAHGGKGGTSGCAATKRIRPVSLAVFAVTVQEQQIWDIAP